MSEIKISGTKGTVFERVPQSPPSVRPDIKPGNPPYHPKHADVKIPPRLVRIAKRRESRSRRGWVRLNTIRWNA